MLGLLADTETCQRCEVAEQHASCCSLDPDAHLVLAPEEYEEYMSSLNFYIAEGNEVIPDLLQNLCAFGFFQYYDQYY